MKKIQDKVFYVSTIGSVIKVHAQSVSFRKNRLVLIADRRVVAMFDDWQAYYDSEYAERVSRD